MFEIPKAPYERAIDAKAFQVWLHPDLPDNSHQKLLANLKKAIQEELTPTQRKYAVAYYVDQMKMWEIAEMYGVEKSCVSRTLSRARHRLYRNAA